MFSAVLLCFILYVYSHTIGREFVFWMSCVLHYIFNYSCIHIHTFRNLAQAELRFSLEKKNLGILEGGSAQVLADLDLAILKAEENLAEVKLFDAIAQNVTDREIEARNDALISIRATRQSHDPISGNNL